MVRWLVVVLSVGLASAGALAQGQGGGPPSPEMMIKRQDADGDGRLSRGEFRGPPQRFDMIDADKDGFLTKEEITVFRASRGGGQGGTPGDGTAGGSPWLNGDLARKLMTDTEISHVSPRSGSFVVMKFKADGTLDGNVGGGNAIAGPWQVRADGLLCFEASALGNRICFYLIRRGDKIQRLDLNKVPAKGIDWTIVNAGPQAGQVPDGVFR